MPIVELEITAFSLLLIYSYSFRFYSYYSPNSATFLGGHFCIVIRSLELELNSLGAYSGPVICQLCDLEQVTYSKSQFPSL